jgi:hydroxymethylpyrimidine/phosphomethylpyrimidine kinase
VHGTGCALSAAICARLARGDELLDAVRGAKAWLGDALRRSYAVGQGRGVPDHLHALGAAGR